MARTTEDPKIEYTEDKLGDYQLQHPAYGLVRVTHPTGGSLKLFGSDLRHDNRVCLSFYAAKEDRHLSHSWYHEDGLILEVQLSEAQWAKMVSSSMGNPTPVTYSYSRDGKLKGIPFIGKQPTERSKASQEYRDSISETLEKGEKILSRLREMKEKGKATKKEIDELIGLVQQSLGRFTSDTEYSVECFQESMDKLVVQAQIEVEASLTAMAARIGAEHLGITLDANLLTNKEEE